MIKGLFLFSFAALFFCFQSAEANLQKSISKAQELSLHNDKQWHNLLHYRPNMLGGVTSQADGMAFFNSKNGKNNPEIELSESIKSFYKNSKYKNENIHPVCRFPARVLYFKRKLGKIFRPAKVNCNELNRFKKKMAAKSLSLVFSSYYLNRPASAFGHTLLRFNKSSSSKGNQSYELLDYAVNYAANVITKNPIYYALASFAGWFRGEFAALPYFYKIREYNDYESRDLWSYELSLTSDEIEIIIAHIWEMSSTYFNYYYLSENCSYHMLALLDVANPSWRLIDRMPEIIIPVDTLHIVAETPGLVKSVTFRSSQRRKLKNRLATLNEKETKVFMKFIENFDTNIVPTNLSDNSKIKVLDTGIDYLDFVYAKEVLSEKSEQLSWKRRILIARSKVKIKSKDLGIGMPMDERPHLGHKTRRIGVEAGQTDNLDEFYSLHYRFSLHDFLDPPNGQNPDARMEMGDFRFRYSPNKISKKLVLEEFGFVDVVSLSPLQRLFTDMSWRAYFGAKSLNDGGCNQCFAPVAQLGSGFSQRFSFFHYYLFLVTDFSAAKDLGRRGMRLGAGPELQFLASPTNNFNFKFFASHFWYTMAHVKKLYSYGSEARWTFIRNNSWNIKYEKKRFDWEVSSALYHYF